MNHRQNSIRYKRLHNWHYIYRSTAHPDKVETNFKLRQRVLKACLEDALNGVPLSRTAVQALNEAMGDVLSGYHNLLVSPVHIGRGAQHLNKTTETMIHVAVSYIALCKSNVFSRKNPIKFVCDHYGVSSSTVQAWYKNKKFEEWKENPRPFTSQETTENNLKVTGEIYQENKKSRIKA